MRYFLPFIILSFCLGCKSTPQSHTKNINVLFIGNSLTYYSNMPQMLEDMLNETHSNFNIHQSTFPGYSLDSHLNNIIMSSSEDMVSVRKKESSEITKTEKKIKERDWDIIVLQTGTVSVLIPEARDISINKAIEEIKALSTKPNCKFILFSTWASKVEYSERYCYPCEDIDETLEKSNCCSPEINNLKQHVELINEGYTILAEKNDLIKSNHTDKACEVRTEHSEVNLYLDDIHPNKNGAFLNACIFYELLTKEKASELKYTSDIDLKTAELLKTIAN